MASDNGDLLANALGIGRRYGGWIAAESQGEQHGVTFCFWLPVASAG